jgi:hypothetical protein
MSNSWSGARGRGARPIRMVSAVCALSALIPFAHHAGADTKSGAPVKPTIAASPKAAATPVRLSYLYKPGDVRRYKVTGFFSGHFPPFASAGSPPIHLMTVLDYVATVKKSSDKGAEVEFNVENADLSLLEVEPGPDGKVDPDKAASFPIPLSQVQKMFNATATLKPSGAITNIQGGDTSSVKIDLGIDLRKLFLVTAPITFADKPVKAGDEWTFDDGLLGSKPGKTTYTGKLRSIDGSGKHVMAIVTQQADSLVDSKLDKEGNSTENSGAAVGTLVGKVTLSGTMRLAANADGAGSPGASGSVTDGKMSMVANLKRTLPDPDKPGEQQVTDIDIHARLYVSPLTAKKVSASTSDAPSPKVAKRTAPKGAKRK